MASAGFVKDKTSLLMKIEGTSGDAEALTSTHHDIKFFDVTVNPEIESYAQEFASGRHSKGRAIMGKRKVTFTAKAALLTSANTGIEPAIGKAWRACGLANSGSGQQVYKPNAANDAVTATIWAVLWPTSGTTAVIVKGRGCMGNCVITMDSLGAPLVATFTFTGALYGIVDEASPPAFGTPNTGYAPGTVSSVIEYDSDAQQVNKFSLDFGNTVELDVDPANSTGYAAAYISKRNPKLSLGTKAKLLSGNDHYDRWVTGTEAAFKLATAKNNHALLYEIGAPKAQIVSMPLASGGELWNWEQTFELHENAGNDEFSIIMDD